MAHRRSDKLTVGDWAKTVEARQSPLYVHVIATTTCAFKVVWQAGGERGETWLNWGTWTWERVTEAEVRAAWLIDILAN